MPTGEISQGRHPAQVIAAFAQTATVSRGYRVYKSRHILPTCKTIHITTNKISKYTELTGLQTKTAIL